MISTYRKILRKLVRKFFNLIILYNYNIDLHIGNNIITFLFIINFHHQNITKIFAYV